ncbi:hypothetical protein MPTK1_2g22220 [Marchantia polymorpha subsp. ruderalis]|uniref:Uncharacterized protein n=1 Tax=Marchantia polymorpha TaxID=3197 RepID=A0A2R6WNF9_MARPO|nr:hypothetical protein MARPO_0072s0105 [Marchantia polymorpha]BBN03276.1 hypothetical protein Mp_2g22220 [Marchantia polymorpha subsp. ruderalis]|eukprot:PTQ35372.1 hypothetical protein MARPO_0072s0105 [Marchantia polymorpha]
MSTNVPENLHAKDTQRTRSDDDAIPFEDSVSAEIALTHLLTGQPVSPSLKSFSIDVPFIAIDEDSVISDARAQISGHETFDANFCPSPRGWGSTQWLRIER